MPVVNIKGVGQASFPDGMSADEIRSFLRNKYSQRAISGQSDILQPVDDIAAPYEKTLTERIGSGIGDALTSSGIISDNYGAQRIGRNVASIGEFLPGIGDATAGDEFGRAVAEGDNMGMAMAGLGAIPIAGDALKKGVKGIAKLDSFLLRGLDNKKLAIQTVKENTDNIARGIEDPEILERMEIHKNATGKSPVLQFTNAVRTTFVNADGTVSKVNRNGKFSEVFEQDARAFMENKSLQGNKKRINKQKTPEQIEAEDIEFKRRRDEDMAQQRAQQKESYKMQHQAPMREDNSSGDNLTDTFGGDIYSGRALQYFGTGSSYDNKAINIIQGMKGKPNKAVTIYRAVPKEVEEINATDWVTTTKEYAREHMDGEQGWHILSKKVKAKDIATDGNSIHEFGYDPVK